MIPPLLGYDKLPAFTSFFLGETLPQQNDKKAMKPFVLNDETIKNNYGFKVLNAGINLERFTENPVCLNDHKNNTKDVLGKWVNLKFEGSKFLGSPEFNTEDEDGKEVVRKVQAGILKGCSLGFDFDPDDFQLINGELALTKCELKEISIVAIPSNAKTITLYDRATGKALNDTQVKELCLKASENNPINITDFKMKKVLEHLQLSDNSGEDAVLEAIKALEGKLKAKVTEHTELKANYDALVTANEVKLKAAFESEISQAVKDGRIDEAGKAPIEEMVLKSGYEQGIKLLQALPKREPIAGKLNTGKEAQLAAFEKMTWSELDKGNHLAVLKADNPELFKQRYKEHFNKEYKE